MEKSAEAMSQQRKLNREPIQKGDWVLELKPSFHPLTAKVDGPFLVKQILGRGDVLLTSGSTSFKERSTQWTSIN
jgi:hypothetical protein